KVSQADAEGVLRALAERGCLPVDDPASADVQVLLTCGVTGEAERSSRQQARRLAALGRPVVVAGCAAALRREQFDTGGLLVAVGDGRVADVDAVARAALAAVRGPATGSVGDEDGGAASSSSLDELLTAPVAPVAKGSRTRFTLKVQDGCAGTCTYCAVRLVRGRPRSVASAVALAQARAALAAGRTELVVSGIDVGAWRDPDTGAGLADMLARLAELPGLARLRLSSLEPRHLTPRLLDALAHPLVARHLHVPLQSADDAVLSAMGRPYTWTDYLRATEAARERLTRLALTTDVIIGFPGEDESAFERTLAAISVDDEDGGRFSRVHVFAYSARAGTAAAALAPPPPSVVKRRAARAREAAAGALRAAAAASRGVPAEVLVEEYRDGFWRGYSSTYVRYYLEGEARRGQLVTAVGDEPCRDGLKGRIT
ncbi:MAG TPA: radical SAM protein, partial [Thermoleophilia bacterium]|nr:radical SAM protein [Thermoleophilia bacterium]